MSRKNNTRATRVKKEEEEDDATVEEAPEVVEPPGQQARNRLFNTVRDAQLEQIERAVRDGTVELEIRQATPEARERLAFYGYTQSQYGSSRYSFNAAGYERRATPFDYDAGHDDAVFKPDACVEPFMRGACCGCASTALLILCFVAGIVRK